ncbi:xanthine dehydrogenase FAD-binding subunit XdhB [Clostridium gasigenes]|uniref:xanthine dehydrogenase FAD-binding subunit XdhB n=1 Tax=Clostridium gasigenes TaxID=94869 RepID=UPI001C0AA770|nr:xanthine dehydrogenase FAD-binding subunit XdhB [Clostridium gasigenes]MBU3106854.1 xanthine dehydrogenase FAD-binding subunit XdhB [Clostridium gasigenes]
MFDIKGIVEPETLNEALDMLNKNTSLKIIAGGTDVLIRLHHRSIENVELISLRKIEGLDEIKILENKDIEIGAMTSFRKIFRNQIITDNISILGEAAVSMGGPQVRNMATIGGNICNGAVSADSASTLYALNAKLKLQDSKGERIIPINEFYLGPGKVDLKKAEILTKIIIEKKSYENTKGHYIKFSNRKAMDIAMIGVAVVLIEEGNKFKDLRVALGVAAPTPIRCIEAENYAKGIEINEENIESIAKETMKSTKARNSWRASKDFREHLIKVLTVRAIKEIINKGDVQ